MNKNNDFKCGQISKIIIDSLKPFLEKIRKAGLKKSLGALFPEKDADTFVLKKIKTQLAKKRGIELGKHLGRLEVQYRFDGIQIEPCGILRFLIKKITITDSQILRSFDDILLQIENKYLKDDSYVTNKIDDIIYNLSDTEIYKPETSEEKTLYDMAMLILVNYYNSSKKMPPWANKAFENIRKGKFIKKWIEFLTLYISEMISTVSENIFINFKVTFDSFAVRTFLNRKTNRGQISQLIKIFNIDIKKLIYSFARSYVSPSFIRGAGEIILELAEDFLSDINKNCNYDSSIEANDTPFGITMCLGENPLSERKFRWFADNNTEKSYIEYSYSENFTNSTILEASSKKVKKLVPVLNLGLVSSFKVAEFTKYSVKLTDLNPGEIYYRVILGNKKSTQTFKTIINSPSDKTKFLIFSDSQGMVHSDYQIFLDMVKSALSHNVNPDFLVHLGDFVDDGNNEEFWKWILDSDIWKNYPVMPLSGNHEARVNSLAVNNGLENSVLSHFNIPDFPDQNFSYGAYYSFVYGSITFIVLNTNTGCDDKLDRQQYNWALNVAKNAKTSWKVILTHKSPYSNGPHHSDPDVKSIGKQIINLAYEGKIDVVFGGHDHVYLRTPLLAHGEKILSSKVKTQENDFALKTYSMAEGTVFVTPGTSGVKNYRQYFPIDFPYEKSIKLGSPVYSLVEATDDNFKFSAFSFNTSEKNFEKIDSFELQKENLKDMHVDSASVMRFIKNIPDCPWMDHTDRLKRIFKLYDSLEYSEKVLVENYSDLLEADKNNSNYKKILQSKIATVKTKHEFVEALKNENIGTIITLCDEIKFENTFGFRSKIYLTRPICIRGYAKLSNVKFILQENAFAVFADSVSVDNNRKCGSIYPQLSCFELYSGSVLILNDNVSFGKAYGTGFKKYAICAYGENTSVYLNCSGQNFADIGIVSTSSSSSKVVVNSGKYLCNKDRFVFDISGILKVNGGFIQSIIGRTGSNIIIQRGIVGENDKMDFCVPIESFGNIKLRGGRIQAIGGVSVILRTRPEMANFKSSESVEILGKILYYE
ncbi:MAG: metallophosphoesterase [Acutalibacteraceae bacterium]